MSATYREMLRELVQDSGFNPARLQLDDAQLAIALTEYDHILVETADRASPHVLDLLSGRLAPTPGLRGVSEEIGILWRALAREHAEISVRRDAELLADEMAEEERIDNEFEVHA